jgi:hypothetical protein
MGKTGLVILIGVTAVIAILTAYAPPLLTGFDSMTVCGVLALAAAWIAFWSGLLALVWTPSR